MAKPIPGAGGVVFNKAGKVLLIKHRRGEWVFPKGHVDDGETLLEAAIREVEEEAGVRTKCPDPKLKVVTQYHNNKGVPRKITWFALSTSASEPLMREKQFPEGAFLKPKKALKRLTFKDDKRLLEAMLEARAS